MGQVEKSIIESGLKFKKKLCSCGFPQSYPIPHTHNMTERELEIKRQYEKELDELGNKYKKLQREYKDKNGIEVWAFKNSFGKMRLDTRWDFHYCVEHIRKGEQLVKIIIKEVVL